MMMLPHLLDALIGRIRTDKMISLTNDHASVEEFQDLANKAEKFSFGEIPLELDPDMSKAIIGKPVWVQPEITRTETEAWNLGLIPLPAPICWYEFELGHEPSGMLIVQDPEQGMKVQRVDYNHRKGHLVYNGIWVRRPKTATQAPVFQTGDPPYWTDGNIAYEVSGPKDALERYGRMKAKGLKALNLASDHYLCIYLTLMLSSLTTELRIEHPPEKLNKARMKAGKAPLPLHRVVTIVPDRYVDRSEPQGGTHRRPRLHWRSSHFKHFDHRTAGSQWMETMPWKGKSGWWVTLVPRHLVGKKEVGVVTHEYFVREPSKAVQTKILV